MNARAWTDLRGIDLDTRTLIDMLRQGRWRLEEYQAIRHQIYERKAMIEAGLVNPPLIWQPRLRALDPLLRFRWDLEKRCWSVDRWVESQICWFPLVDWREPTGEARQLSKELIDRFEEGDMQRYPTARAYLEAKHKRAEAIRRNNARIAQERRAEVIARMSRRAKQEYSDIMRALHTRERIVAHGPLLRFLEFAEQKQKQRLAQMERRP